MTSEETMPEFLYKYCSTGHAEQNLKDNKLHLSSLGKENDPFEGACSFSTSETYKSDFISFFLKCSNTSTYNLTNELDIGGICKWITKEYRNELHKQIHAVCFSESYKSIRMWGHYADSCQGICLKFDTSDAEISRASKVVYCDNIYKIEFRNKQDFNVELFLDRLLIACYNKSSEWDYEKEWRILTKKLENINYSRNSLKAIYFGCYTPEEDKRKLVLSSIDIPGIQYLEMEALTDKYALQFVNETAHYKKLYAKDLFS